MPRREQPSMLLALSPMQAAAALGIHVDHIYAIRDRRLVARMYGAKRRIAVAELIAWQATWPDAPLPVITKRRKPATATGD